MRLARRRRGSISGASCWLLSPEDTILAKLEWMRDAPSDRQKGDVMGVLSVQAGALDREYLEMWAERLGGLASAARRAGRALVGGGVASSLRVRRCAQT